MLYGSSLLPVISPYLTLLIVWRDLYWDTVSQYPLLWISLLFYGGTTGIATFMAYRFRFRDYYLDVGNNVWTVLIGCLFSWLFFFPFVSANLDLVMRGLAPRRADGPDPRGRRLRYFKFIILIGLTFIVYCMWAMVIPGLIRPRVRDNAARAVSLLKQYATAQHQFVKRGSGDVRYCDDFRRLYYGIDKGEHLGLIPKSLVYTPIAFAGDDQKSSLPDGATPRDIGYVFLEDPYVVKHSLWGEKFGLIAYPVVPGESGFDIFWIGSDDIVLLYGGISRIVPLSEEESPLHLKGAKLWEEL